MNEKKKIKNREFMRIWSANNREEARKRAREQYLKIKTTEEAKKLDSILPIPNK